MRSYAIVLFLILSLVFAGQVLAQCGDSSEKACCGKEKATCSAPGCENGCSAVCMAVQKALKENCKACKGNCSDACMKACTEAVVACVKAGCTDCSTACKAESCSKGCSGTCKMACAVAFKTVAAMDGCSKSACGTEKGTEGAKGECKTGCSATTATKTEGGCTGEMSMEEYMAKYGTPGENHAHLKMFAGNWNTVCSSWMAPGQPPEVSKGTSSGEWIMDGRYLVTHYKGNFGGMTFTGMGIMGYDNMKQQYFSVWMDNFGTGVYQSTGKRCEKSKTMVYDGEMNEGATVVKTREVIKVVDENNYTMTMYRMGPDGSEIKMMEIAYARCDKGACDKAKGACDKAKGGCDTKQ
jgi:hypothetical protein